MRRSPWRWMLAVFGCSALAMGSISAAEEDAAQADQLEKLVQVFWDELVVITPGEGPFPRRFRFGAKPAEEKPASNASESKESESKAEAAPKPKADPLHRLPPQEIELTENFRIAKYEVPQNLYTALMKGNPSRWPGRRNSVEMMTGGEAQRFCQLLEQQLRHQKLLTEVGVSVRLPTEIEWEYCCRAGTTTRFSFGDDTRRPEDPPNQHSLLNEHAWHTGNAAGNDPPVGALKPNPWGLYDMHGYLREFTSSPWTDGSEPAAAAAPLTPPVIVLRGGSWKDQAAQLESAARMPWPSDRKDDAVGFRCVVAKPPQTPKKR
jgi:formylglycine-generating enzyme required for sulfatase activity